MNQSFCLIGNTPVMVGRVVTEKIGCIQIEYMLFVYSYCWTPKPDMVMVLSDAPQYNKRGLIIKYYLTYVNGSCIYYILKEFYQYIVSDLYCIVRFLGNFTSQAQLMFSLVQYLYPCLDISIYCQFSILSYRLDSSHFLCTFRVGCRIVQYYALLQFYFNCLFTILFLN